MHIEKYVYIQKLKAQEKDLQKITEEDDKKI